MRKTLALLALAALAGAPPAAAQRASRAAPIDWAALREEAVGILSEYLRIDTTNPPGNELEAARFLKRILDREGIPAEILDTAELGPGRANLYARLPGTGRKKAIALVHHMDVVPADRRYWTVDPFAGEVRDGFVYGRGAQDMKGYGVVQLMAMVAIERSGLKLDRDLVFIANADEEAGSTGAITFAERHADLLEDVEYLLTEGGGSGVSVHDGKASYFVSVGEKRAMWQHVVVHGVPSHGSQPTPQNPVPRLVAALDRIARHETPLHVVPAVERYFRALSAEYEGEERAWMADVRSALADPRGREWMLSSPGRNALLRNTVALTGLQGSPKVNVIPAEASADLDVRLLPDQDPHAFLAELQRVAADTAVHFSGISEHMSPPLEVPFDTDLFRAIERAAHERDPGAPVSPAIGTGGTDRPRYRPLGIVTYGFSPFRMDELEQSRRGAHGNDERISVENLEFGMRLLYDVLRYAR
jgi:acetylornithine deacetylase/succinyl-diaminopimelate desuccinylase-like protein